MSKRGHQRFFSVKSNFFPKKVIRKFGLRKFFPVPQSHCQVSACRRPYVCCVLVFTYGDPEDDLRYTMHSCYFRNRWREFGFQFSGDVHFFRNIFSVSSGYCMEAHSAVGLWTSPALILSL